VTEEGLAEELDEDEDQVRVAVAVVAAIVVAAKLIKYYVNLFTI
jgi:phage shock protein PspC (stress-responsive transcriptional regulator)